MFGGKKAKELEEELLALQEKQNRLQERISNIAKAKDSAEETVVQMTISKTDLDETIGIVKRVFRGKFRTDRTVETAAYEKE